jgi:tetratricopeptide (TPR) repeat protein
LDFRYFCQTKGPAHLLANLGQFEAAITFWSERLTVQPDDPIIRGWRAMLYSRTGQYSKAEEDLSILDTVWPQHFTQAYHYYWLGETDRAIQIFNSLMQRRNFMPSYRVWGCLLIIGDMDIAVDYMEQHDFLLGRNLSWIFQSFILDRLRNNTRYQALLRRFGIDDQSKSHLVEMVRELEPITGIHLKDAPAS